MITVLMPTYNVSQYVGQAIRSILDQTYDDFEFLIIDDCSNDDTVERIKSFRDRRIRLIENDKTQGISDMLNIGLNEASNELIARMDGDDISFPTRFEKQLAYLKANLQADVISSDYAMFDDNKILYTVKAAERHADIRKRLALHSEIMHPAAMFKKRVITDNNGYRNIKIEDYELWLRIKDNVAFGNVPEVLLLKRYRRDSLSLNNEEKKSAVYEYTGVYFDNLNEHFGIIDKEVNIYKGWREYFYGNKKKARKYFLKSPLIFLTSTRAIAAFFSTFLNEKNFEKFKELRIRFRLNYIFGYFSEDNRLARKQLRNIRKTQNTR